MAAWSFKNDFWFSVLFVCKEPTNSNVYLVGDFNGWQDKVEEYKTAPCSEGHCVRVELREGYYRYKFSINGEFIRDHSNPHVGGIYDDSIMFVNMDPGVYGLKNQQPPYREYQSGNRFVIINPIPPQDLLAEGVLQRLVFLYLPPSYNTSCDQRYPVIYAHDGQNLFSTPSTQSGGVPPWGGWYLDAKLDNWWSEGIIPEFILVGVPNSDFVCVGNRQLEYTCTDMSQIRNEPYVRYITSFLKPLIDKDYRTQGDLSYVVGASLGGLMSFLMTVGLSQKVFKGCISMSPALWFVDKNNKTCFDLVKGLSREFLSTVKVYIDSGDGEGDNKEVVKEMAELMRGRGLVEGSEFMYVFDECKDRAPCGVTHSEWVWRERVLEGLKYVLSS